MVRSRNKRQNFFRLTFPSFLFPQVSVTSPPTILSQSSSIAVDSHMDYDYRNRTSSTHQRTPPPPVTASLYPRLGQQPFVQHQQQHQQHQHPPGNPGRAPYATQNNTPPPTSGMGIRVAIKPEYKITPPPQLVPQAAEVPRSTFLFDFEFEKKFLAEVESNGFCNWSKLAVETQPLKAAAPSNPPMGSVGDPTVEKYAALGLSPEAVSFAVLNYGDDPVKVHKFVKGYDILREMGFSSKNVGEVLAMHDCDTDKALGYLLNSHNYQFS